MVSVLNCVLGGGKRRAISFLPFFELVPSLPYGEPRIKQNCRSRKFADALFCRETLVRKLF